MSQLSVLMGHKYIEGDCMSDIGVFIAIVVIGIVAYLIYANWDEIKKKLAYPIDYGDWNIVNS